MSLVDKVAAVVAAIGAELKLKADAAALATVATSGAYGDLTGTPAIPDALTDLDTTVTGAQLNADHTKLAGIAAGAEVNVQSDWNASSGDAQVLNKPTIPTAVTQLTGTLPIGNGGTGATSAAAARTALGVPATSIVIATGSGLTGGGDLSTSRTLRPDFGNSAGTVCEGNDSRITGAVQSGQAGSVVVGALPGSGVTGVLYVVP